MANIKIKVDFYDKTQETLIEQNFPVDYNIIKSFANTTIDVPIEDFKTYSLFRHGSGLNIFSNLNQKIYKWVYFEDYFDIDVNTGKLINIYGNTIETLEVPETLGVAGGLSVASHIYGFTQADWTKIPKESSKDFDFKKLACTIHRYINIETKGTILSDGSNSQKLSSIPNHKSNITNKKIDEKFKKKYNYATNTCIGIITVADKNNILQSWIVDPAVDLPNISPFKIKLLKRLYFYFSIIQFISKRSYLSITLANRISTLELVSDIDSLNKLVLLNYNFQKLEITDYFIDTRAYNKDKSIIGKFQISDNKIYFIGLLKNYLDVMVNQNFEDIITVKSKPFTNYETIIGKINKSQLREKDYSRFKIIGDKDKNHVTVQIQIKLIVNSAGLCIGRINLE